MIPQTAIDGGPDRWDPMPPVDPRIRRLNRRYQEDVPRISVERARYYTESWKATEGKGIPLPSRVALAMQHVYENMQVHLDPDDRIAGYWTEHFLGVPVDIERGVFNQVFETELTRSSMVRFRAGSLARALRYMARKRTLGQFLRNQRIAKSAGAPPLDMGLKTMSEREINPYRIDEADRRELQGTLLPYWKGKTLVDRLEAEMVRTDLYSEDMHDFVVGIPGNTSRQVVMLSTCATIATIQGHVILDHGRVLRTGLEAMRTEVRSALERAAERPEEERHFLASLDVAIGGVMIFAARLAARIEREVGRTEDPARREILTGMLERCRRVPFAPARTFPEAVQALWTVKTAVELAHPVNLHCFGRLDQILHPYYMEDLEAGRITPHGACELLEELLLKIMSQNIRPESNLLGNFYHRYLGSSPVTVGGQTPEGQDATNELTYLFLEAAHRSKAITNLSVRVAPDTPDELLDRVARYLHEGTSTFALYNDPVHVEAMRRRGFEEPDARDYAIMGCVEATCPGKTGSMSACALLLSRLLDITLRNGDSATLAGTMRAEGLRTGSPDRFATFEDLLEALQKQGAYFIEKTVQASNLKDRLYAEHLPAPLISAFMDGCLENRRDVTRGGAVYDLSGISMINSIANLVDSLHVIQKLVYEERRCSLGELVEAVDRNFRGHEELLRAIHRMPGKWGNGNPETDELARRVTQGLFDETHRYENLRGGPFVVYAISMITHTIDGRLSIATPDGRAAATPYAASCNPYNVEREGVTATLRSVAALPFEDMLGCAVNVKFHPSGIGRTPEGRAKWIALIRAYFGMGGAQVQPTVASTETLRRAQREPEQFRDLIVKVGGYSTYFVDLGREIQEEVIARTEHV